MARPRKSGLDYFPMDVDADADEKVEYVVMKHGFMAFGIYVKLLMSIYKEGYYMEFGERRAFVFAKRIGMEPDALAAIINEFVEVELFDKAIYERDHVLTSASVQRRFLAATERRKGECPIKDYLLINVDNNSVESSYCIQKPDNNSVQPELLHTETPQKPDNNSVEPNYCAQSDDNNPQSKVKESKVKESKVKDIAAAARTREVVKLYEDCVHPVSNTVERDELLDMIQEDGYEWVTEAIKETARGRGRSIKYVHSILRRWRNSGRDRPWENSRSDDPGGDVTARALAMLEAKQSKGSDTS